VMNTMSTEDLGRAICEVASTRESILFAGAGVGKRAGLPDWKEYIEHLTVVAEKYEKETATLMRLRYSSGLFTVAISLYKACPLIPQGVKLDELAIPFLGGCYDPQPLRALLALPFNAIVTTNFDRSLLDAYAQVYNAAPVSASIGDPSLKQALYNWRDYYIARIHGCAEIPRSMVLDNEDYQRAKADVDYTEFLIHILTHKVCLFMGYSFVDPAILHVLEVLSERAGPNFPKLHTAIVPASASHLAVKLAEYNIRVLYYDPTDNHSSVWRAVRGALDHYKAGKKKPERAFPRPLEGAHHLLAAAYARMSLSRQVEPLRKIVREGIVIALLQESQSLTNSQLADQVRQYISLSKDEAIAVISNAIADLTTTGLVKSEDGYVTLAKSLENRLRDELSILVNGVEDRLVVSYGTRLEPQNREVVEKILEDLILARGWDLGASLASAKRSDSFDISPVIRGTINEFGSALGPDSKRTIASVVIDLIQRPNAKESDILVRLARLAFGVEMALERGRSLLAYSTALPQKLYLDANVLMPSLAEGHPYREVYVNAIEKLQDVAKKSGTAMQIVVLDVFLNEIVAHRANAISLVNETRLNDPERLARYINLTGADFTNVFVGSYASVVGRKKRSLSFEDYLKDVAPYRTEDELKEFLRHRGILTESSKFKDENEERYHAEFFRDLDGAYEDDAVYYQDKKPSVLIAHEAKQLARLLRELGLGIRVLFVTADSRLRRLAVGSSLGRVAGALFSHIGLLQFIDLLIGFDVNPVSLSRLMWAIEARDVESILRGYFIDRALRSYDAAMAMAAPRVVDEIVEQTKEMMKETGIRLASTLGPDELNRTLLFLDRFEDKFFENMAKEIKRQREKNGS
jgi:hypothetical protein